LQSEDVFIVGCVGSLQESKAFWGKAGGHQWDIRQRALRSLELPKWENSSKMTKVKKKFGKSVEKRFSTFTYNRTIGLIILALYS
jgi:hypothetical protein